MTWGGRLVDFNVVLAIPWKASRKEGEKKKRRNEKDCLNKIEKCLKDFAWKSN